MRFDTRKAVALLAYLAVTGRPQQRDVLAALLWPELDQTKARGALRRTLSVASKVGPSLRAEQKIVLLDADQTVCDVQQFRAAAAATGVEEWRKASDLATEPFMAGFSLRDSPAFDDWQAMTADELRDQMSALLGRLVDASLAGGDAQAALVAARRRVAVDSLSEPAHVDLIRSTAMTGDRPGALRHFRSLVRVLDRELGVPPLPETVALHDTIRAGGPKTPTVAAQLSTAPTATAARRSSVEQRCVGRDRERAMLLDAWRTAATSGAVRGVVGEPGMGRTTLMSVFAADLVAEFASTPDTAPLVVVLRGVAAEQGLAYSTAGDLVRALLETDPELPARLGAAGEALNALTPASEGSLGGIDSSAARRQVHEAVRAALATMSAVVIVDDAHLVDAPSAELLGFVARRCPVGVLLVATWLAGSGGVALPEAVRDASGGGASAVLGPLTADDVALLAGPDTEIDPADVVGRTRGVPLLVTELVASGERAAEAADVVAARLDAAPATTQQVVGAAVVIGTVADPDLLRATCGRDENETVEAIEDAVSRALLVERPELGGYDIPHELVRAAASAQLGLARRRLLHGRVADTLARRHGVAPLSTPAGAVAHHLVEAGRESEAASWYWRAAQESSQLYAHAEAVEQLRTALALGYDSGEAQAALGSALTRLGRYGEALLAFEQAAATADGDGARVAEMELRLAEVHDRLGEWDVALDRLQTGLEQLDGDTALAAQLQAHAALLEYRLGRVKDAERRARAASEMAVRVGDRLAGGSSGQHAGRTRGIAGRFRRGAGSPRRGCASGERGRRP